MKELTSKSTQIIQQSLHVAEQVLTGGAVSMNSFVTNAGVCDVIDELHRIKTASTADDADKVIEMVRCFGVICFTILKGYANPASIPSTMYDYTLDEYQAAVQHLGIPVGGENQ